MKRKEGGRPRGRGGGVDRMKRLIYEWGIVDGFIYINIQNIQKFK